MSVCYLFLMYLLYITYIFIMHYLYIYHVINMHLLCIHYIFITYISFVRLLASSELQVKTPSCVDGDAFNLRNFVYIIM